MAVAEALQKVQKVMARKLHPKWAFRPAGNALVSFTFDDFPRSAWTAGGKVLAEYGVRGTYYAALGLMGKTTAVGEMFGRQELEALAEGGHELACHTHDHALCSHVDKRDLLTNCEKNQLRMSEMLGGYRPRNFSFPEGVVTVSAKALLTSVYDTCRTIEPGINCDPVDLSFLLANPVYSASSTRKLQEKIQRNRRLKGWLILYTHDISRRPSAWGCTPEEFRAVVGCAADSGAEILPICDAMKRFVFAPRTGLK
jgi:peptidoglycan/xylan/chitin deacetylase (PgdA/CDA1 family)